VIVNQMFHRGRQSLARHESLERRLWKAALTCPDLPPVDSMLDYHQLLNSPNPDPTALAEARDAACRAHNEHTLLMIETWRSRRPMGLIDPHEACLNSRAVKVGDRICFVGPPHSQQAAGSGAVEVEKMSVPLQNESNHLATLLTQYQEAPVSLSQD
jgi:hypothetical protein